MNKILIILSFVILVSCGLSQEEDELQAKIQAETERLKTLLSHRQALDRERKLLEKIAKDKLKSTVFEYYDDGQLIKVTRQYGRQHGPWEMYHENGQLSIKVTYKLGVRHGPYETYYENGQLDFTGNWKDGKQEGLWEGHHENGALRRKVNYKDGKLDGLWEGYHENGQLESTGNYKDGKQEGLWESYYKSGRLDFKENYKKLFKRRYSLRSKNSMP
mgnify:CR=1 FL=1